MVVKQSQIKHLNFMKIEVIQLLYILSIINRYEYFI